MTWYKIVVQDFPVIYMYQGISHLSLVLFLFALTHSPKGLCAETTYNKNTSALWEIPQHTIRKHCAHCITSIEQPGGIMKQQ